jgi:hypothetical protein
MQKAIFRYRALGPEAEAVVLKTTTLPLLTTKTECLGEKTTFVKDGKISGLPAYVQIFNPETKKLIMQGEGMIITKENGSYVVPLTKLNILPNQEASPEASSELSIETETPNTTRQTPTSEGVFGFSYQQILLVAAIAIVITKLTK